MSTVDFSNLPPEHRYSVNVTPAESDADRYVRLAKDFLLFLAAIAFVGLIVWICYSTLVSPVVSAEEKKWAMSVLSGAVGGVIGYLVRK
jgi:membrane associated rhomboid family serine protease